MSTRPHPESTEGQDDNQRMRRLCPAVVNRRSVEPPRVNRYSERRRPEAQGSAFRLSTRQVSGRSPLTKSRLSHTARRVAFAFTVGRYVWDCGMTDSDLPPDVAASLDAFVLASERYASGGVLIAALTGRNVPYKLLGGTGPCLFGIEGTIRNERGELVDAAFRVMGTKVTSKPFDAFWQLATEAGALLLRYADDDVLSDAATSDGAWLSMMFSQLSGEGFVRWRSDYAIIHKPFAASVALWKKLIPTLSPDKSQSDEVSGPQRPETDLPESSDVQPDAMLSCADLAATFRVHQERLRKRLERLRGKSDDGWREVQNRGPKDPKYLYRVGAVLSIIGELTSSVERPPEKNI